VRIHLSHGARKTTLPVISEHTQDGLFISVAVEHEAIGISAGGPLAPLCHVH